MLSKTPAINLYQYVLDNKSLKQKKIFYQAASLVITLVAYTSFHIVKRPFSVVKPRLAPTCNATKINNKCFSWKPFDNPETSTDLFGMLDFVFLTAYALSMFISGPIAEHTNLRIYLTAGMIGTGIVSAIFGLAHYFDIHSIYFFLLMQVLAGIFQSTGWPCVVEVVGNWFEEGRRGFIMGIWNIHVPLGNILGALIAGAFVETNWGLSFIVPGVIIASLAIVVYLFLIPHPKYVQLDEGNCHRLSEPFSTDINPGVRSDKEDIFLDQNAEPGEQEAISFVAALKIPGVIEYSICLLFGKLVSYTFLFWLPFYIKNVTINGYHFTLKKAASWAVLFDLGGIAGGIVAGGLLDYTQCPGIVNLVMLLCAAPTLFLFQSHGKTSLTLFALYMTLSGFFINGPFSMITTAVSANLGTHGYLKGKIKAMAVVTSIIDATGSLGAAVGPMLAGVIVNRGHWKNVFIMLTVADLLAALLLLRQFLTEIKKIYSKQNRTHSLSDEDHENFSEIEPLMSNL